MLLLLSPAKIQNFSSQQVIREFTEPEFINEAETLVNEIRKLSIYELSRLLNINAGLAELNVNRHFNWHRPFTPENAKQAVLAYNGEVFHGLNARIFPADDFVYLQSHLRILSGLYGVLRPLDLIQPYRLEISTKLEMEETNDLYAFWGDRITVAINEALKLSGGPKVLLNLSSGEYFKSINRKLLQAEVIDFDFLESNENGYKSVVVYIKKARGMMVRYVIENRIENTEDLKGFSSEGYWFNEGLSTENKYVFSREPQPRKRSSGFRI